MIFQVVIAIPIDKNKALQRAELAERMPGNIYSNCDYIGIKKCVLILNVWKLTPLLSFL